MTDQQTDWPTDLKEISDITRTIIAYNLPYCLEVELELVYLDEAVVRSDAKFIVVPGKNWLDDNVDNFQSRPHFKMHFHDSYL